MRAAEFVKFDPRVFISPPYIKCPKCGAESFGILMICAHHYCRRCRDCFWPPGTEVGAARYPLPKLKKKVIYLDQFVISNMMKALNPRTKAHQKGTLDRFWLELFERVDSLCKLQLIVCPRSIQHTEESLLSSYYKALKRMYQLLSHDIVFFDNETILRFQIREHAENWARNTPTSPIKLNAENLLRGNYDGWQDRLIIAANFSWDESQIVELRETRDQGHEAFGGVFQRWQSEGEKTFDDWFREEIESFGRVTLEIYFQYAEKIQAAQRGVAPLAPNDILPPFQVALVQSIHDAFAAAGVPVSDVWPKTAEYLTSPYLRDVPSLRISSLLYAGLARRAASGQKKLPTRGMMNDVQVISALLPYCDAMFLDNECASLLQEQPLRDGVAYPTRVFSLREKHEFIEYLNAIEAEATPEHLNTVKEVYGQDWHKPYVTMYKDRPV